MELMAEQVDFLAQADEENPWPDGWTVVVYDHTGAMIGEASDRVELATLLPVELPAPAAGAEGPSMIMQRVLWRWAS